MEAKRASKVSIIVAREQRNREQGTDTGFKTITNKDLKVSITT